MKKIKKKVLFLCTNNSIRSQMAEGILKTYYKDKYDSFSAGINPAPINPYAVEVMKEIGIDLSNQNSKSIKKFQDEQAQSPGVYSVQTNGTAGMITVVNAMGGLPTKNFQMGTFVAADEIAGEAITQHSRVKGFACASCAVACSLISEIKSGPYAGTRVEGPEYETAVMLGSNLMIGDRDTIIAANHLCDELGLDTISTGNVIGFAMECFEKGLLTTEDTGGLSLRWGDGETVLKLIEMIAANRAFESYQNIIKSFNEINGKSVNELGRLMG